jgi:hypothetical protein
VNRIKEIGLEAWIEFKEWNWVNVEFECKKVNRRKRRMKRFVYFEISDSWDQQISTSNIK